jgi:hypothetical protein
MVTTSPPEKKKKVLCRPFPNLKKVCAKLFAFLSLVALSMKFMSHLYSEDDNSLETFNPSNATNEFPRLEILLVDSPEYISKLIPFFFFNLKFHYHRDISVV